MIKRILSNIIEKLKFNKMDGTSSKVVNFVKKSCEELDESVKYCITIADSCVVCNKLQILWELHDETAYKVYHILEEFVIGSKEYIDFVNFIYCGDDSNIVVVDLEDFDNFLAYGYGYCVKEGHVKWEDLMLYEMPLSATYQRRLQLQRKEVM